MISDRIIHVHLGLTGGHIVRRILDDCKIGWLETRAHLPLHHAREHFTKSAPAFTVIRNPFDWYIAWYLCELKNHRWRGTFRDWFYHRRVGNREFEPKTPEGMWMWQQWLHMTELESGKGPDVDFVCRFENLSNDLAFVFNQLIPGLYSKKAMTAQWGEHCLMGWSRMWIEGIETWLRDELWAPDMIEDAYERDAPIFDRFGYTFGEKYYFPGGIPPSFHKIKEIGWEHEKCRSSRWRLGFGDPKPWKPSS